MFIALDGKVLRRILSISSLLTGATLLIWAVLPVKAQVDLHSLDPASMSLETNGGEDTPAIPDGRQVRLEYPAFTRIGEQGKITLDFISTPGDGSPPDSLAGFSDAYREYNVMVETRVEAAGIRVEPGNPTRESLPPGQPVRFTWKITTDQPGGYDGKVWLSLRFLPLDGGEPVQAPVYVGAFSMRFISLVGFNASAARFVGGVGLFVGILLTITEVFQGLRRRST